MNGSAATRDHFREMGGINEVGRDDVVWMIDASIH